MNPVLLREIPRISIQRVALYLSIAFAIPTFSVAQQPLVPKGYDAETANILHGLIHLDVEVANPSGHSVLGLKAGDVTLLDNGRPTPILSFTAYQGAIRPDPPVAVMLVLDTLRVSGGGLNLEGIEYAQVEKFLQQNGGHLAQRVTIIELSDAGLWQLGEPSFDGNALADAIAHHRRTMPIGVLGPRGTHGFQPAVKPSSELNPATGPPALIALKALGAIATAERRKPGRKLVIWVGPGWGLASGQNVVTNLGNQRNRQAFFDTTVWISTLLRLARVTLYSFSLGEDSQPAFDAPPQLTTMLNAPKEPASPADVTLFDLNREMLAVESGGDAFPPATDIVAAINNCLRDQQAFYTLSFNPPPAGHADEYHALKVVVRGGKLTVRTTTGYYDEPYFTDTADPAIRRVTIAELEQLLDGAKGKSDGEVARLLEGLQLTQQLNLEKRAALSAQLHGKKAREALEALADLSAFRNPPPAEILADPPPDSAAQQRILAAASDYLNQAISKLPDFFATRFSVNYAEAPAFRPSDRSLTFEPFRQTHSTRATVLYRNGREVVDAKLRPEKRDPYFLATHGVFGPILSVVKAELSSPDNLSWLRWEKAATGQLAVFHYTAPQSQSLYNTASCCIPEGNGTLGYSIVPGYDGEIAIDPSTGAILHFTVRADLNNIIPVDRSEIAVIYGPEEIGGRTYILPLLSVSLMRQRTVQDFIEWDESFKDWGPYLTTLNAFEFSGYHKFRAEVRILDGSAPAPEDNAPPQ